LSIFWEIYTENLSLLKV